MTNYSSEEIWSELESDFHIYDQGANIGRFEFADGTTIGQIQVDA